MAFWDSAEHRGRPTYSHPWLANVLFAVDARLRRRLHVFEYTQDAACIFRLEIGCAQRPLRFQDGEVVHPGQRIARLHFWNEHVPAVPHNGVTIAWARRMQRSITCALRALAVYLRSRPDLDDIAAICADVPSGTKAQSLQLARLMAHYGFEATVEPEHLSLGARAHRLGENILISLIVFAQNAAALRSDTLERVRLPILLSRQTLEERFGGAEAQVAQEPTSGVPEP